MKELDNYFHNIHKMNQALAPIYNASKKINQIIKPITNIFNSTAFQLIKNLQELPERIKISLLLLANEGWFIDLDMPLSTISKLKKLLEEENFQETEKYLCNYFDSRIERIEKTLITEFPHRAKIIQSAFNAHKNKEYILSIPILLAQVDGICKELTNIEFFRYDGQRKNYVQELALETYEEIFLLPFSELSSINISQKKRPENFSKLNRHMIIHGESLDYGTYENSLKVISLISYISTILKDGSSREL